MPTLNEWGICVLFEIRYLKNELLRTSLSFRPDTWHRVDLSLQETFGHQIVINRAMFRKEFLSMAFSKLGIFRKHCYLHYTDLWVNLYFIILFFLVLEIYISTKLWRATKNKSMLLFYSGIAIIITDRVITMFIISVTF